MMAGWLARAGILRKRPPAAQKKFAVSVVSPPGYIHSLAFAEVAESMHHGLLELGHDSVLTTDVGLPGRQHIVLGSNLLPKYPLELAQDSILYNLEQVEAGGSWFPPELLGIFRRHVVWDYSEKNARTLKSLGVNVARILPIGYVKQLTRIQLAAEEARDIDVLFIGAWSERREQVIQQMAALGLRVGTEFGVYGAQRDAFLARAKVVLNLHLYNAKVLEMVRISYLLANRCVVLSEWSTEPAVDALVSDGVAFADYDQLAARAVELVADLKERQRLSARGFEIMQARSEADFLRQALG